MDAVRLGNNPFARAYSYRLILNSNHKTVTQRLYYSITIIMRHLGNSGNVYSRKPLSGLDFNWSLLEPHPGTGAPVSWLASSIKCCRLRSVSGNFTSSAMPASIAGTNGAASGQSVASQLSTRRPS